MRFLVDESCDAAVERALRIARQDVVRVADVAPGATDDAVLMLAVEDRRMLVTEDKDFGQWVYAEKRASAGVILLRFPAPARSSIAHSVVGLVRRYGDRLHGCFAVLQPGRVRLRRPRRR